ncbi:MAG: transposase [Bacteroidales bacterium]
MDDSIHNKFRPQSTRLASWDYGSNGKYFLTICTAQKIQYFGLIRNSSLVSTAIGDYVKTCWESIPEHYPFVELDTFILMPDHLHGILCFGKKTHTDWNPNQFGPQIQNLAAVVRGLKSAVTSFAKANSIEFHWQPRYFDRIIRNDKELDQIREYIRDNPGKWKDLAP